jgi:CRISPR-associated exonuclease Cas4
MQSFARVSDLTSYIYCPRLCYYRLKSDEPINEMHAAREIYLSRRKGMDDEWAFERLANLYKEHVDITDIKDIFLDALKKFRYNPVLDELDVIEWEIALESEKLRLKGSLDEIVAFKGERYPLVLSLKAPEKDVWFRDRIRITAFCMLLSDIKQNAGFVYHCFDGELRKIDIGRRERYHVLKLVERVLRLKKGFIPEKVDDAKCKRCIYSETCKNEPSTFASRFL